MSSRSLCTGAKRINSKADGGSRESSSTIDPTQRISAVSRRTAGIRTSARLGGCGSGVLDVFGGNIEPNGLR